ncbi:hypothetical protein OBP_236 [Pseudomonas phage OBP]|uniref:hypothetical protein n=1 Tax=Pseudomonas phage OBP TaxID=1124849 RepID=UPI000240D5D0|nr:hypothetical protein OBP_236 [Pseudomonas phage OBP]AEV89673.1 hypothetical protein OBP_236 [Pseudomonas phage OBP]
MDLQDIKNVAGVAYVQTRLQALLEQLNPLIFSINEPIVVDGMCGNNTIQALSKLAHFYYGVHVAHPAIHEYVYGMNTIQQWYRNFHHQVSVNNVTTIADFGIAFHDPEMDGKWGKDTKACFDIIFSDIAVGKRKTGGADPNKHAFHTFSVASQNDSKWVVESEALLRSALAVPVNTMVSVSLLTPYNVVIFARDIYEGKPRGVLVARKITGNCSVSKFAQDELFITGLHVNPDLEWDDVAEGMISKLLEVSKFGGVKEISHAQTFQRGPMSKRTEELLVSKFSFYKTGHGTVTRRG